MVSSLEAEVEGVGVLGKCDGLDYPVRHRCAIVDSDDDSGVPEAVPVVGVEAVGEVVAHEPYLPST